MKKIILMTTMAVALLMGITSCRKDHDNGGDEGRTGNLKISFSIVGSGDTRAITPSTAKPVTDWSSISNLMILFVDATNEVKDARTIPVPTGALTDQSAAFTNVKANTTTGWTAYLVGNYPAAWTPGNVVGKYMGTAMNQINLQAPAITTSSPLAQMPNTAYGETPEFFVARQTGVRVDPSNPAHVHPNTFQLARAVSLFRVRINQSQNNNDKIDFSSTTKPAEIAIRRVSTGYNFVGTYNYSAADVTSGFTTFPGTFTPTTVNEQNVFYKQEVMKSAAPPTAGAGAYQNGSSLLDADNNITLWNDYMIWPGGSTTTGSNKFDIVISGVTRDNTYVALGEMFPSQAGTRVYWTAAVQKAVGPNQILELIITLNSAGSLTPPEVGTYGNLEIATNLVNWGDIFPDEMEL